MRQRSCFAPGKVRMRELLGTCGCGTERRVSVGIGVGEDAQGKEKEGARTRSEVPTG